jgi:hypothetical protein
MRPITLKIPAGAFETLPRVGNYVRLGDGSPTVTVTDEDSGEFANLQAGDAVQFARPFRRLRVEHAEVTTQTVVLDTGFGRIIASRINGEVQPIGGAANLAAPPTVYAADVVAALESLTAKRAALTDLTGCSIASANNATVTIVSAAGNTAGVRIATLNMRLSSAGSAATNRLDLDGVPLFTNMGVDQVLAVKNVFVPAGIKVDLVSSSADAYICCAYEVLP